MSDMDRLSAVILSERHRAIATILRSEASRLGVVRVIPEEEPEGLSVAWAEARLRASTDLRELGRKVLEITLRVVGEASEGEPDDQATDQLDMSFNSMGKLESFAWVPVGYGSDAPEEPWREEAVLEPRAIQLDEAIKTQGVLDLMDPYRDLGGTQAPISS